LIIFSKLLATACWNTTTLLIEVERVSTFLIRAVAHAGISSVDVLLAVVGKGISTPEYRVELPGAGKGISIPEYCVDCRLGRSGC
jgi:hypothetical protein